MNEQRLGPGQWPISTDLQQTIHLRSKDVATKVMKENAKPGRMVQGRVKQHFCTTRNSSVLCTEDVLEAL